MKRQQREPKQVVSDIRQTLRDTFGFADFRPNQESIIRHILSGRDVFAVMPTGGGKSLCYQLPARCLAGTCVVISPLISLMKDQVDKLRAKGLTAEYLNSSLDGEEQADVLHRVAEGGCDLLYVAPERFAMPGFQRVLSQVTISLFAIDEAHCVSEWGHDFRPDYLQLAAIVSSFPRVPIAAFTATATERVQEQIAEKLGLREPYTVRASFDRPNLFYEVAEKTNAKGQILRFVRKHPGQAGIIYRTSRSSVEETADFLIDQGIKALPYHAGLGTEKRKAHQEAFDRDRCRIIVATIAFGMGIDKPNVRFILHADLPKSMSGYYQETGRAGRNGEPAHCLLLFGLGDISRIRYFIRKMGNAGERVVSEKKLQKMVAFASTSRCRRRQLLSHFGESYRRRTCDTCDMCRPAGRSLPGRQDESAKRRRSGALTGTVLATWRGGV